MVKETMTSRQRVVRAINHEPVDRMPIDFGSHMSSGISMFAYWNLREHLCMSTDHIRIPDMVQCLAYVDTDILTRFHCDCILLEPPYANTLNWNPRGKYHFAISALANPQPTPDGGWIIRKEDRSMCMPGGGFFFDGNWISDWGSGTEYDRVKLYAKEAERMFKETDYAINFVGYSHGLGMNSYGAGDIDDAMLAYDDPKRLHEINERKLNASIARMGKILDSFGSYIQMVTIADDMGTQNGPMCSPDYVEEFCMPYYKKFCDFVHSNSDIKVLLHSCGSIRQMIPIIIDAGFDIINPVQISAENMDPQKLKVEFGERICFWGGGCDTQRILGSGAPGQVSDNVTHLVCIFRGNSGYVFNQVHNIMGNVPPENIVAMLDTAYRESFVSSDTEKRLGK